MKIDQIIVLHLNQYKQVSLQEIGIFYLDAPAFLPLENDMSLTAAAETVTFKYDAKATEDASLIASIVYHTKKLKSLASSDLDSFLHWQKQLLNINMPFTLPGIGMLQKISNGQLLFVPAEPSVPKVKAVSPSAKITKDISQAVGKYSNVVVRYSKKMALAIIVVLGLCLSAWVFLYYVISDEHETSFVQQRSGSTTGLKNVVLEKDNVSPIKMIKTIHTPSGIDSVVFKIIFLETKNEIEAIKKLDEIYGFGHSAIMYLKDSGYKIAIPFNRPLTDTSLLKDSLNRYYSLGKGLVEVE